MDPSDAYRNNPMDINRFSNVPTMGPLNTETPVYSTLNSSIPLVTSTYNMHVKTAGTSKYGQKNSTQVSNTASNIFLGDRKAQGIGIPHLKRSQFVRLSEQIAFSNSPKFLSSAGLMATAFMPFRFAGFDIGVNEQEAGIAVGTNAVVLGTMVVDKTTS